MAQATPKTDETRGRPWWRRPVVRFFTAIGVGVPFWLMVPDTDLWFLGFVAWIPWIWLIDDLNVKQAFFYGLVSGISAIAVGYFWMTELLSRFAFPEFNPDGSSLTQDDALD